MSTTGSNIEQIDMLIAGVDEAGRGPLAGPVIAAAVILDKRQAIPGIRDSKVLSDKKRESLSRQIKEKSIAWSVASVSPTVIDEINILNASLLAMKNAVLGLQVEPSHVQVDGNRCPDLQISVECIVKGDALIDCIGAASIIAKVTRDRLMVEMDAEYPGYGFSEHKGYPTRKHIQALTEIGVCEIHRKSYAPVKKQLGIG